MLHRDSFLNSASRRVRCGHPVRRLAAVILAALLATAVPLAAGFGATPAVADPATGPSASSDRAAAGDSSSVPAMLILDASGSMRAKDGDSKGTTRMAAAKQAATRLVNGLPDDAQLGLTVYGAHTGSSDAEKAKGCKDVDVVTPVGSRNAQKLKSGISSVKARGYTPIGTSLRKAADALPKSGDRAIVLVSDGIDTCAPPPPCKVAKELKKQGVDLTVHTIGFRVGKAARADLSCIAKSTGGQYSDAQDEGQLSDQLETRTTRALQGYEVSGDPIKGGTRIGNATMVKPGQYLDSLEKGGKSIMDDRGSQKFYAVHVTKGERIHASATVVPPAGNAHWSDDYLLGTKIEVTGQDGTSCADENGASGDGEGPSEAGDVPLVAAVNSKPVGSSDDTEESCDGDTLYLHVSRSGPAHNNVPFPLELVVAKEEPGAIPTSGAVAKPKEDKQGAKPVKPASEEPLTLGRSFSKATALKPGSFVMEMVPGDVRMAKIPVQEGQRLRFRAEAADSDAQMNDVWTDPQFNMNFYNPLREPVRFDDSSRSASFDLGEDKVLAGGMPVAIRAANRNVEATADRSTETAENWLGGDQYIMFNMSRLAGASKSEKNEPVRVQVTFEVVGKATDPVKLTTSHGAPTNAAVDDKGQRTTGDASGGILAGFGRTPLLFGAIGAGVVAILAALGATVLIRRRR